MTWALVVAMALNAPIFAVTGFADESACLEAKRQFIEQIHPKVIACIHLKLETAK